MGDRVLVPVEWDDAMLRAFYEKRCPPDDTPAGSLTRWASWEEVRETEGPRIAACWKAALSAAPSSGEGEPVAWREGTDATGVWRWETCADRPAPTTVRSYSMPAHPSKALSVEEVARALYESSCLNSPPTYPWDTLAEVDKDYSREQAVRFQAILAAMGRA